MDVKEYELIELRESLKAAVDYYKMEQSANEALRKEIRLLKVEISELKGRIKLDTQTTKPQGDL